MGICVSSVISEGLLCEPLEKVCASLCVSPVFSEGHLCEPHKKGWASV